MKKGFKALLVTFVIGLLLVGVGSGVCFAEVTNVQNMGTKLLQAEGGTTRTHEERIDLATQKIKIHNTKTQIVVDETLRDDQLVFEYLDNDMARFHISQNYDGELRETHIYLDFYVDNWQNWAQVQRFIADLRNNEFYYYEYELPEVILTVSPNNKDKLVLTR